MRVHVCADQTISVITLFQEIIEQIPAPVVEQKLTRWQFLLPS